MPQTTLADTKTVNALQQSDLEDWISHELRNPLHGLISTLQNFTISDDQKDDLTTLDALANYMQIVLSTAPDLANLASGSITLNQTEFNLGDALRIVEKIFKKDLESQKLYLKIEFINEADKAALSADKVRFMQILINLLSNAKKFTTTGGIIVRLKLTTTRQLECEVEDTGEGMSESVQKKLFQAFQQADDTVREKKGGTGIGLVLSRQLSQLMGGNLSLVKSEIGKGSTFKFTMNYSAVELTHTAVRTSTVADEKSGLSQLKISAETLALCNELDQQIKKTLALIPKKVGSEGIDKTISTLLLIANHMMVFLCNELDLAKFSAGKMSSNLTDFGLQGAIEEAIAKVRKLVPQDNLVINFPKQTMVVRSDRTFFISAITNFLFKFILDRNNCSINMNIAKAIADNAMSDYLQCTIKANAEAAVPLQQEQFAQDCFPLMRANSRAYKITESLRLELIKLLSGKIFSTPKEEGFQVAYHLPSPTATPTQLLPTRTLKRPRVLIVDDNEINRRILSRMAGNLKCDFELAINGQDAIEKYENSKQPGKRPFDIIFMDFNMPILDGKAATIKLREDHQAKSPIIGLTATSTPFTAEQIAAMKMNGLLAKPFGQADIKRVIDKHVKSSAGEAKVAFNTTYPEHHRDRFAHPRGPIATGATSDEKAGTSAGAGAAAPTAAALAFTSIVVVGPAAPTAVPPPAARWWEKFICCGGSGSVAAVAPAPMPAAPARDSAASPRP